MVPGRGASSTILVSSPYRQTPSQLRTRLLSCAYSAQALAGIAFGYLGLITHLIKARPSYAVDVRLHGIQKKPWCVVGNKRTGGVEGRTQMGLQSWLGA